MEETLNNSRAQALVNWFETVIISNDSRSSRLAKNIEKHFPIDKIKYVDGDPFASHRGQLSARQFDTSKKTLFIKPFDGQFFKRCPGFNQKKVLTCCNYHVLNLGQQCNLNCSYCYLQSYLNTPTTLVFSNIEQAIQEIDSMASQFPDKPFRVGTGEVIDSLSLDPLTLYSRELIQCFNKFPNWHLEFKTKSNFVEQFLDCEHRGNVIVSWSINCNEVIESEETRTSSLNERFAAARKCLEKGFKVAFHLDPMVWFPDWEIAYTKLIQTITQNFKPSEVNTISVGTLRFQPEQRHIMRERFGFTSKVVAAEMFSSEGNKLRYDQRLRSEMLDMAISTFKSHDPKWRVVICMETPETWIQNYEMSPMKHEELKELFQPLPSIKNNFRMPREPLRQG